MPGVEVFDRYAGEYDEWFVRNENVFLSELALVKSMVPDGLNGFEIGVGGGRFAVPLGIRNGLEPSGSMAKLAEERGIQVIQGKAEMIVVADGTYDFVLMVTTICFVDDPEKALREARRILKPGGFILIAFVPSDSWLGSRYLQKKDKSIFYRQARFFSVQEVNDLLVLSGFTDLESGQTLFEPGSDIIQAYEKGHDRGSFVALKGHKSSP